VKVQRCIGHWVCFGTRVIVLSKSGNVEIVQDGASVFNVAGKVNGGVGGKKGYIYSCSCDLIVIPRCVG
jgi:hypothetical protein